MPRIDRVAISNFASFGTGQLLQFVEGVNTIVGVNLDEVGTISNGVGKSSALDALQFGLFGDYTKKLNLADVIRCGEQKAMVVVDTSDTVNRYRVYRSLEGGSAGLSVCPISVDETVGEKLSFKGTTNGQKLLHELWGINDGYSKEDFLKSHYFSKTQVEAFASSSTGAVERMRMFIEAVQLDKVSKAIKEASDSLKAEKGKLEVVKGSYDELAKGLIDEDSLLEEQSLKRSQDEEARKKLAQVEAEITSMDEYVKKIRLVQSTKAQCELKLQKIRAEIDSVKKSLEGVEAEAKRVEGVKADVENIRSRTKLYMTKEQIDGKIIELEKAKALNRSDIESCVTVRSELGDQIGRLRASVEGLTSCPKCQAKLLVEKDGLKEAPDREEVESQIEKLLEKNVKNDQKMVRCKDFEKDTEFKIKEFEGQNVSRDLIETEASALEKTIEGFDPTAYKASLESQLNDLQLTEKSFVSDFESGVEERYRVWTDEKFESKFKEIEEAKVPRSIEMKDLNTEINALALRLNTIGTILNTNHQLKLRLEELSDKIGEHENEIAKWNDLIDLFEGFRRDLLAKFIPAFEARANDYLADMGFGFLISLELFKENRDGSFKPEMNIQVSDGRYVRPFNGFSEGERLRVSLACQFALMDLAKNRHFSILMLDEVLDSLDEVGFQYVIPVCKKIAPVVVVTSRLEKDKVSQWSDQVIVATKQNGVSTLSC